MPIRKELRHLYPVNWPQISREVRFARADGRCEQCGRPHKQEIRQIPDGRWFDSEKDSWRDDCGGPAPWPDMVEYATANAKRVMLAAAHLDHNPGNSDPQNLRALCQRCHLRHDRAEHRRRIRITILMRRALGDLFLGPYRAW